ncbi:MAG: LPXTG cell wall anchor domain-containing protein [Polaribacter sp.]|nr:LPXTG cell wall anchor domain-containing protein [Polaribacter sp.]MDG1810680.1 LPXTG cell wall anchor domain-containing protein [Polaribacter sp.]MDG1993529.1 LPXTG cell wall anchor domain-containing protein [Polaribacter sp.]
MKKQITYILLLFSIASFAQQKPVVKAEIDTTNIRIGEQFEFKITVNDTANVIIPELENIYGIEIIENKKIDTLKNQLIKKYILTSFDSGAYYIPQQQIFIRQRLHLTDSLLISVATIAIDTTKQKMFPIKSIQDEPMQFDDYKPYIWYVLIAIILIGLLLYFILRKKKEKIEEIIVPTLPPFEEAIQKLQQLDEKLLWQNNQIKEYYSELTEIVRGFIERELKVPALESTTDELIDILTDFNDLKAISTTKETIKKLRDLLREADLVKFAKSRPMSEQIEANRKDAEEVVTELKPEAKEEPEIKIEADELD